MSKVKLKTNELGVNQKTGNIYANLNVEINDLNDLTYGQIQSALESSLVKDAINKAVQSKRGLKTGNQLISEMIARTQNGN